MNARAHTRSEQPAHARSAVLGTATPTSTWDSAGGDRGSEVQRHELERWSTVRKRAIVVAIA